MTSFRIESFSPTVDGGKFTAKKTVGDTIAIEVDVFRHGHDPIEVNLIVKHHKNPHQKFPMKDIYNDRWQVYFELKEAGLYTFQIEASTTLEKQTILEPEFKIVADAPRAISGNWYEIFIRSQGKTPGVHGTFKDAMTRLPDLQKMGFNVLYLAPIHPIGKTARKGPNDSLNCSPTDPGSPWAIGNELGGHTAIDPQLGTFDDFKHFVKAAKNHGMDLALDLAMQCSPDHPWVSQHPEWFYHREDGTIQHASNPPYEYQDVYPLNFEGPHAQALWNEIRNVVLFWVSHGVKIFRVDNPHSKPFEFWSWLIASVQNEDPETIFLAEAFTRPKIMKMLSKGGFSQSYTYFIWRNTKEEIIEYMTELTTPEMTAYFRPNFFTTTHDILPQFLQTGGRAAFQIRALLAGTLSPSYGIYNGYELLESEGLPGKDEYLDSEKFEIKIRDWDKAGNIKDDIAWLNQIRAENSSLQQIDNVHFLETENSQILAYLKISRDHQNKLITVINLDPHNIQEGKVLFPKKIAAFFSNSKLTLRNLRTHEQIEWDKENFIRLDPHSSVGAVYKVLS